MSKLHDIKLKEYIFSTRFRNSDFKDFMEFYDSYRVSENEFMSSIEKAYFSYLKYSEVNGKPIIPSQEYIFDLETKLIEVLAEIEYTGFLIDANKLKKIGDEMNERIKKLEEEIYELVGERFNLNSPKQLQVILFEKLQIPTNKKIKTGFSVDNEVLEVIGQKYAIANLILEHRGLRKLLTTYIDGLLKSINKQTKRIHTTFNQTQTSTGRLSSENPNLQNIPSGNGYAEEIKSSFIPRSSDYEIMVADYSQVELRVLANLSRDPVLLDAFKNNEDIHTRTAKFLFGEDKQITGDERRKAKTVNFGVIYGISGFGLSKQIGVPPSEATIYINKFYEKYAGVTKFYAELLEKARETGFVETFFGRRRYINGLNDANKIMKAAAEREAINMPIQGTAADVIKIAMVGISNLLKEGNYKTKMILQVHDELVFELHKDEMFLKDKIKEIMENVYNFEIKLTIDIGVASNWKEAKK